MIPHCQQRDDSHTVQIPQVMVVGAGAWGQNLIRNFHRLGALSGVVEPNSAIRQRLRKELPDIEILGSFEQALAHRTAALVIATPASTHFDLGIRTLEAGKDVFIEKPMTMCTKDARKLVEYAEQTQRILMTGHLLLYQSAVRWISDYLQSGEAGAVLHVHTMRAKLGTARSFENVWWSFAPHDISIILEFLGTPNLESVTASSSTYLQEGIPDSVHADLIFSHGQTAHVHTSWYWPHNDRRTIIITSNKMITYNEVDQSITIHDKRIDGALNNIDEGERVITDIADTTPLEAECRHFLDCIKNRTRPKSDGRNGLAVVEVLERVQNILHQRR